MSEPETPQAPIDPGEDDEAVQSLTPQRDLGRFTGLMLFGLMLAGVILLPILALLALLFSLPYFAAMFGVAAFLALAGVYLLEVIRLRGWKFSLKQLLAAWLLVFLLGTVCTALGLKQYRTTWAAERQITLGNWEQLSTAQRHLVAEELVAGRIHPTLAELIEFREHAEFPPRQVVYHGRFVQEFGFAIGPWKISGQESLVVRIDRERRDPMYTIEKVDTLNWK